jgi:hypothetical protein
MRFPHNTHSPPNYLAHPTAPLLHISSQFDQQSVAAVALPGAGGGARATNGDGRGRGSILGGERKLGGNATTVAATMAAATDRVNVVVVDKGGGSSQRRGNDVLPPPLLIPSASAEFHPRPGDLDRSKVASRIIKLSVASRHIFGGGGKEGGDEGKQQRGR